MLSSASDFDRISCLHFGFETELSSPFNDTDLLITVFSCLSFQRARSMQGGVPNHDEVSLAHTAKKTNASASKPMVSSVHVCDTNRCVEDLFSRLGKNNFILDLFFFLIALSFSFSTAHLISHILTRKKKYRRSSFTFEFVDIKMQFISSFFWIRRADTCNV